MERGVWIRDFMRQSIWIVFKSKSARPWVATWVRPWVHIPVPFLRQSVHRWHPLWVRWPRSLPVDLKRWWHLPWARLERICKKHWEALWTLMPMHLQMHSSSIWRKMIWRNLWCPCPEHRVLPMIITYSSSDMQISVIRVPFPFIQKTLITKKKW